MEICQFKVYIQNDSLIIGFIDKMAEWLWRWTVNPLGFAPAGSNPSSSFFLNWFHGEMNSNLQFGFNNPSSNLGKKLLSLKPEPPPSLKLKKNELMTIWKTMTKWLCPGSKRGPFEWLADMITTTMKTPDRTK